MDLNLSLLRQFIDFPADDQQQLRHLLDDLGLEVEGFNKLNDHDLVAIETLANRGDHLSVKGVSRELYARFKLTGDCKVCDLEQKDLPDQKPKIKVDLQTEQCPVYSLMELSFADEFTDANLIEYLENPVQDMHPVVNYSNYLLNLIGQPTHAFDADLITGDIKVVLSTKPEKITALDNKEYEVPENSILICDQEKIIAVGGVIGCANSMVTADTKKVYFESAVFDPTHVRKTARGMGLSTDASYLFERGVDIHLHQKACKYLLGLSSAIQVHAYASFGNNLECKRIVVNYTDFCFQSGEEVEQSLIKNVLESLGYEVTVQDRKFSCLIPSWRYWNVNSAPAIIEDFIRVKGLNTVPAQIPPLDLKDAELHANEVLQGLFSSVLLGNGYEEVITRAYYSADDVKILSELDSAALDQHVQIINSLEGAYSNLKTTNVIHLAKLVADNIKHGLNSIKVFEYGRFFSKQLPRSSEYEFEEDVLSLCLANRYYENEWAEKPGIEELLYQLQSNVVALCSALRADFMIRQSQHPYLHPGRQAEIVIADQVVATFGEVHPQIAKKLKLNVQTTYAELYLSVLKNHIQDFTVPELLDYPKVKWDLTFKLNPEDYAASLLDNIAAQKPQFLESVNLIADFRKEDEDFRRVSCRLYFQNSTRTLSSAEVDQEVEKLLNSLKKNHALEIVS